jgi:hypothetical protein
MRHFLWMLTGGVGVVFYLGFEQHQRATAPLPTLIVLPSLDAIRHPDTHTIGDRYAYRDGDSHAKLHPYSDHHIDTNADSHALDAGAGYLRRHAGRVYPPTAANFPFETILLSAPPQPIEPPPDATNQPPTYDGWVSFESENRAVQYNTLWESRLHPDASRGQYHRSENVQSYVRFNFDGEGLRIRYVAARNMGIFQVVVDGVVIDTVDAYPPELTFPATRVYTVGNGSHTLELRSAHVHNPQSEGYVLALDAVVVFRGTANTLIIPPPMETDTPTPAPMPGAGIQLVGAGAGGRAVFRQGLAAAQQSARRQCPLHTAAYAGQPAGLNPLGERPCRQWLTMLYPSLRNALTTDIQRDNTTHNRTVGIDVAQS